MLNASASDRKVDSAYPAWMIAVAAASSVAMSIPLLINGTPDVESYSMSIFSTVAFVKNLLAGVDPWFVPGYGFGIPLPSSTWLIKYPLGVPAALGGSGMLYAAVWIGGEFVFGLFILKLAGAITRHRGIAALALVTGLLSFSNLGTTYKDDWPEHFMGWAWFPACLWFILQTLLARPGRERVRSAAACALVLGIFAGSTHQNEMVTFFSGIALVLGVLVWSRPGGVLAVALAALVAIASALDVLLPTVEGMLAGRVNPFVQRISVVPDYLTLASYGSFLEPARAILSGGLRDVLKFSYERVPFFGFTALLLAVVGAIQLIRGRVTTADLPKDILRSLAVGFIAYSALTLMPSWVALGLPRMWMYRDGQTVFAILCAVVGLEWVRRSHSRLLWPVMLLQCAQLAIVAAPFATRVFESDDARLYGHSRHEPVLFDELRQAGIDGSSRVALAGELEELVKGGIPAAGLTSGTDFPLEGLTLVNAWYRGGETPALGIASMDGRYGLYETLISWKRGLKYLDHQSLSVLGITHVLVLEGDRVALAWAAGLVPVTTIQLPGRQRIVVLRNNDAWSRAVLLDGQGPLIEPSSSDECDRTIYCSDLAGLSGSFRSRLNAAWDGSTLQIALPEGHAEGRLFVSVAIGPSATATVDGMSRPVHSFMQSFGTVDIHPEDRVVALSVARRRGEALTIFGIALLVSCLAVVVIAGNGGDYRKQGSDSGS